MRLAKRCRSCWEMFDVDRTLTFEFYCQKKKCQAKRKSLLQKIKKTRSITMKLLDVYDLDRPIYWKGEKDIKGYERVCRICGQPLHNKDGTYSKHRRYCSNEYCNGYKLFELFNWTAVSKKYAEKITKANLNKIKEKLKRREIEEEKTNISAWNYTLCEQCNSLCFSYNPGHYLLRKYDLWDITMINIHHKTPVHTLTWENILLIWDKRNLIALCENCHHKQDHKLSKKAKDESSNYEKITKFLGVEY